MFNRFFFFFLGPFWAMLEKSAPPIHCVVFDLFAPLTFFSPNFARESRIRKSFNFDLIFSKTNRNCFSATLPPNYLARGNI